MIKNKKGFTLQNFLKKNLGGFTLMELLIVVAIIAILAAGLIVGLNPARQFRQARNSTRWSHMNAIATAVYSYAVEHGGVLPVDCIGAAGFPEPIVAVDYKNATSTDWCWGTLVPEYLRVVPKDPQGESGPIVGQTIYYQIEFEGDGIKITSTAQEAIEAGVELIQ